MRLISTKEVKSTIASIDPVQVAVAYVGQDWKNLLGSDRLSEIVVSPTLGSNPESILEIVEAIGWDRVHFLTRLHSKIYLGENAAAFGSFNLSRNGILAQGLEEFGAYTDVPEHLSMLKSEFDRLKARAIEEFPTELQKREALQQLRTDRTLAARKGILPADARTGDITGYFNLTDHDFYVVWYVRDQPNFNEPVIAEFAPDISLTSLENGKANYTTVLESDPIEEGQWVLCWQARTDGLPNRNSAPYWLYADHVIPNGVTGDNYTKLVIENPGSRPKEFAPFSISETAERRAVYETLSSDEFMSLRRQGKELWGLSNSKECLSSFVKALKTHKGK